MFRDSTGNSRMTTSQHHSSAAMNFVNLTLFMMSNNFFEPNLDFSTEFYSWIKRFSDEKVLKYLFYFGGPTAEALTEQLFLLAIEKDDASTVKRILDSGLDHSELRFSTRRCPQNTPLQRACQLQHSEVVRVLLDAGADVNSSPSDTISPLSYATELSDEYFENDFKTENHTDIELVHALLRAGAKVNPAPDDSPLLMAARGCQVEIVATLLSAGADPNFSDELTSITPLIEAVLSDADASNVVAVVRLLLKAGASVHDIRRGFGETSTVLENALHKSNTEVVQILLSAGAHITEFALTNAIKNDKFDVIKLFLSSGARVAQRTIEAAADRSKPELFKLLLEYADVDSKERIRSMAFVAAIHNGWNETITNSSPSGIKLQCDSNLRSAIEAAAERGDISVIRLLLDENSTYRANALESLGCSLYLAVTNGHNEMTETLLAAGADVNCGGSTAKTPLLGAIHRKDADLSYRLLAAGARVNSRISNNSSILLGNRIVSVLPDAVAWGNHELIRIIISAGAKIDGRSSENNKTSLTIAAEKGDFLAVQLLVDAGADINAIVARHTGHTALAAAVNNNNTELVRYLLVRGAVPDENSLIAAVPQSPELMQLLLQAKPSRDKRCFRGFGCRALQRAITSSNAVMIEALLSSGIDSNVIVSRKTGEEEYWKSTFEERFEESAFGTAIRFDRSDNMWIIRALLSGGADPNQDTSERGDDTVLLMAIKQNNLRLVKILIAAGANVNPKSGRSFSCTPLQFAVEQGYIDITVALMDQGAEVNAWPCQRYVATALQLAAIKGYLQIASILLERGADINGPRAQTGGRTALEGACEYGRIEMLDFLLKSGALVTGIWHEQHTRARKLASENGHIAARRLLDVHHAEQLKDSVAWDLSDTDFGNVDQLGFEDWTQI